MVLMVDEAGNPQEFDPGDIYDRLSSGKYQFGDSSVPVFIRSKNKEEESAYNLSPSEARDYILAGRGEYMGPERLQEWKEQKKYGSGYEIPAAALGVADALTLGGTSALFDRMGIPASPIARQNPKTSLVSEILTTGTAMALAGPAAPAVAGAKFPALAKTIRSIANVGRKAPWAKTAPGALALLGAKARKGVSARILGQAGEEVLEKSVGRGLIAQMGGMSADGLIFAAGYGTVDAVARLYDGKDPADVATHLFQDLGTGMVLGAAIPLVFQGTGAMLGSGIRLGKGALRGSVNWAADTEASKSFYKHVAKGVGRTHPEKYGDATAEGIARQTRLAESMQKAHHEEQALQIDREIISRKGDIAKQTGMLIDRFFNLDNQLKIATSAGHTDFFIRRNVGQLSGGSPGAASSPTLAHFLTNGTEKIKEQGLSYGFLDGLEYYVAKAIHDSTLPLSEASPLIQKIGRIVNSRQSQAIKQHLAKKGIVYEAAQIPHKAVPELTGLLDDIQAMRDKTRLWTDQYVKTHGKSVGRGVLKHANASLEIKITELMSHPGHREALDVSFNSEIFNMLENLSSRVHRGILRGPLDELAPWNEFRTLMKDEIRDLLTHKGNWSILDDWNRHGVTPFGNMANAKRSGNALLTQRDELYNQIEQLFMQIDPGFVATGASRMRPSPELIKKWIGSLDHENSRHAMELLEQFANMTSDVSAYARTAYRPPSRNILSKGDYSLLQQHLGQTASYARNWARTFTNHKKFLTEEVAPALEYAAILQRERNTISLGENPSLLPYAFGLGIGGVVGGIDEGGFSIPGAVTGATIAGAARFGHDAMLNPGRALAKLHTWFIAADMYSNFIDEQVRRYFMWVNHAKKVKPTAKAPRQIVYKGPGDQVRWPRLFVSNRIAKTVSEREYEGKATGEPGTKFGEAEFENAKVVANALTRKETQDVIIEHALADLGSFDPRLRAAAEIELRGYLDKSAKAINDIAPKQTDMFSKLPPPSDTQLQKLGEELAVREHGAAAVLRSAFAGTLTKNEIMVFWDSHPKTAQRLAGLVFEQMQIPGFSDNIPPDIQRVLKLLMNGPQGEQQVIAAMQSIYDKKKQEEEEKPGPKPQPKWVQGKFPGAQLSGSYAIEQRRAIT